MEVFFKKLNTPYETIPFDKLDIDGYLPAAKKAIELARERIEELKRSEKTGFDDFLVPYLESSKELDLIASVFFNLHYAETNDSMESVAGELSPLLAQFSNNLLQDKGVFFRIKELYEKTQENNQSFSVEERTIIEDQYKTFIRNGSLLSEDEKESVREIDERLAILGVEFGKNALQANNQFYLQLSEDDLEGIPQENWSIFKHAAEEKGLTGYAVTFDAPVYIAFMQGAQKRELRKKVYKEYVQRATSGDFDNREICKEIILQRRKRANILGYPDHSSFILERRMAKEPDEVIKFLNHLKKYALPRAKQEIEELSKFAKEGGLSENLMPWDFAFYSEKYKKHLFDFDDEVLRPYFKLENVIRGVFDVASRLYGIQFKENKDIAIYHQEVESYEVISGENQEVCGILYTDFFPRPSKRQGAWMCCYREQSEGNIPHIGIVCNFTKPTATRPSLLTHQEVLTLFHEFGHALHGLLSKCRYRFLSGTQVYRDFVELPSQMMENWTFEKECLDLFARQYETKEPIPQNLMDKLKQSRTFQEGYATLRQLSFAHLDMMLHQMKPESLDDILEVENKLMKEFDLFNFRYPRACMCTTFSHIFNGGYSAGYYGYKWAEVLEAHAFELFKKEGIFNPEIAKNFRNCILARGGSEHPMILYKRFRGEEPSIEALLDRSGLTVN